MGADAEPEAKADAEPYYGYYGYARPYGGLYGYRTYGYYGKRSADAEPKADANPYLVYSGLHTPYAYGHGYGLGYGYHGLAGYSHYYGKRSADAEPEPYYGYYGYARPYGYTTTATDGLPDGPRQLDQAQETQRWRHRVQY